MDTFNVELVADLYLKYHEQLREVRAEQRELLAGRPGMRAQLDDLEAEITYLALRHHRPEHVVEVGSLHGYSTTWILRALRDNGHGQLRTFDRIDNARHNVPAGLAAGRWQLVHGDVRRRTAALPSAIDYLFVDAAHSAGFARWYLADLMPRLAPGTPVSVHDVFHHRWAVPGSEGAVLLRWLAATDTGYFTAARAREPQVYRRLLEHRRELGFDGPVHAGSRNPMIYFTCSATGS